MLPKLSKGKRKFVFCVRGRISKMHDAGDADDVDGAHHLSLSQLLVVVLVAMIAIFFFYFSTPHGTVDAGRS